MTKKYIAVALLVSIIIAVLVGIVMPKEVAYKKNDIEVDIETRLDSDSELALYYLTQDDTDFNEGHVIKQTIKKSDSFETVRFILDESSIKSIRLDCDASVSYWDIKNITLKSDETETLGVDDLSSFYSNDIKNTEIDGDYLCISTGDLDPFISKDIDVKVEYIRNETKRIITICIICLFLFIIMMWNWRIVQDMLVGIFVSRKQIKSLAISDFKSHYSGSYLGIVWGIIQPLMTIILFWFVFQKAFHSNPVSNAPFILWLIAGMIPWNFFSDAWVSGTSSFISYNYIVKKLVFNIDIIPLVKIMGSSIINLIFNGILLVIYTLYGWFPGVHLIDMLYFSICVTLYAWGLSMITATLNVFMKDVGQLLSVVIQFLMWLTPVMWDYHMLDAHSFLYLMNPLFYIVNGYREALIDGQWFFHQYNLMLYFWFVTIIVNIIGIRLMKKLRPHFADVL